MYDPWDVFVMGLDPARLERERFTVADAPVEESFPSAGHRRMVRDHEVEKSVWRQGRRALEDADRAIERQRLAQARELEFKRLAMKYRELKRKVA